MMGVGMYLMDVTMYFGLENVRHAYKQIGNRMIESRVIEIVNEIPSGASSDELSS